MKKAYSLLLCVLLCALLPVCSFADDTVQLRTVVPAEHEITVSYNNGGYVLYRGEKIESGTKLTVPRHDVLALDVLCAADAHLQSVTVNGKDATALMQYGRLTLPSVSTDVYIAFDFAPCSPDNPEPEYQDPCVRLSLSGGVYVETVKNPLIGALLTFDYDLSAETGKNGKYSISAIKDGRHLVTIRDADGKTVGKEVFVIAASDEVQTPTVERLTDGTQILRVPADAKSAEVDFFVEADGSVTLKPVEKTDKPITDNPIISTTGALLREYPAVAGAALGLSFLLLLLLFVRRRKQSAEDAPTA